MTGFPEDPAGAGSPTPRRRVLLVTPGFSASEDDWCIPILRDFAEGLAERNDVSVIALRYPGDARTYRAGGADVVSLGGGTRKGIRKLGLVGRAVGTVAREARNRAIDVIHAFWAHEPGAVACGAGRITGVPVVVTLMGGELAALPEIDYGGLLTPGNRAFSGLSLRMADRVVALSGTIHRIALERVGPERLRRLDFGVRTDRFRAVAKAPTDASGPARRFLCVGSLIPVKGHEILLRAFARCHAELPGTSLELVGGGELEAALRQFVRNLGIESAVRFTGAVDHSNMAEIYNRSDVLVVSSWWEGALQAAHEALACALPIVGTGVGILPDLGEAARCVPVGDTEALGREMVHIASSADIRRQMAAAAAAAACPIQNCIAAHEQLYDSIRRGRDA